MRILTIGAALGLAVATTGAMAQPVVVAIPNTAPNAEGWTNTVVRVEFDCARVSSCPQAQDIDSEGASQDVAATVRDEQGREARAVSVLHIDRTAPTVAIQSPRTTDVTRAPMVSVVALASDAVSGVKAARCNGLTAAISDAGRIECAVRLHPGPNDVIVDVSDRADNSASAAVRVLYRGVPTRLEVVPDMAGVVVGSARTFQVVDEFGQDVPEVTWHIDNPAVASMSDDGRHELIARSPGTTTLTAQAGGLTATTAVTIYGGDRLPPRSVRWRVGEWTVVQTPDTVPLTARENSWHTATQEPGGFPVIESINKVSGRLNWRMRPGAGIGDRVTAVREHAIGGTLLVVESAMSGTSALVRSGGLTRGRPWRYQSAGRIDPTLVLHTDGGISLLETLANGFPRLVMLRGETGEAVARVPLPHGVHIALNIGCVPGANVGRLIAPRPGPISASPRGLQFPLVVADDREEFERCGSVSGQLKRTLYVATLSHEGKRVDAIQVYEVPAGSAAPAITMFPVIDDGHGALLVAWTAIHGETGTRESRVVRLSESGRQEYQVPAAGQIWLAGRDDLALMTDGARVVVFDVLTGDVQTNRAYPDGVRILSAENGEVLLQTKDRLEKIGIRRAVPR